jgi:hypothetical protein
VPLAAVAGFGLMGAGLAAVVPTIFRAAGSQQGIPSSVGIAAVSTMGYAGGLMGPPIIGTIARAVSLRVSLLLVLVMLAILALSARRALAPAAAGGAVPTRPGGPASRSTRPDSAPRSR